jgi:large subunit ribosomal protein L16
MLMPKKVKHRKWHKGRKRNQGTASRGASLSFGSFGIKSLGHAWITARQIEAARRSITHYLQRGGKVWIRIFPDKPVTQKSAEVPMGGGKGAPDHFVAVVKPGTVLFEIEGVSGEKAREAMRRASHKLPVKTKFLGEE